MHAVVDVHDTPAKELFSTPDPCIRDQPDPIPLLVEAVVGQTNYTPVETHHVVLTQETPDNWDLGPGLTHVVVQTLPLQDAARIWAACQTPTAMHHDAATQETEIVQLGNLRGVSMWCHYQVA